MKSVLKKKLSESIVKSDKVYYSINKKTMQLYHLIQITIEDGIAEEKILHKDIPPIVYGKLLGLIQNQGFNND